MTTNADKNDARRSARLAAVQGLYRIELAQQTAPDVIRDFYNHPPGGEETAPITAMDRELFSEIVTGVTQDTATLDDMISGALSEGVSAARIEILLRAILRAGVYELYNNSQVPPGIIINDYVDVTHAFFGLKEPGLVNAVLDKVGKKLRQS
jgi:N utilization substance protein B